MRHLRIAKKLTACLVSLSMILSMAVVYAAPPKGNPADHTDTTTKAELTYKFLGTSPAAEDKNTRPAKHYTGTLAGLNSEFTWEENGLVWVGITIKNATRLRDVFNSGSTDSNDDAGMNDFVLSLAYDTDYFGLPQNSNNDGATQSQRLLQEGYPKTESGGDVYVFSNESEGLDYAAMLGGASAQTVESLHLTQSNNSKVAIYRAKLNVADTGVSELDGLLFQDGASIYGGWNDDYTVASPVTDDEITLFVIPLRMKGATPPEAGTKAIEGYFDMAGTTITVGHGAEGITYEYSKTPTEIGNNGDTNIKNYFNISALVDLFPAGVAKVPVKTSVDGTVSDTGNTINSSDTAYKFSDIRSKLGANPTKAGYTFAGWSLTAGGTVLTDNSDVTVSADMKDAGITFYAVFTKDKVNYTAADFTVSDNTVTYNKAAQKPTVALKSGVGGTIDKVYVGAAANNAAEAGQTNQGTYKVYVDVTPDTDHNAATKLEVGTFTINKLEVAINITDKTADYTGSAISVDEPTVTTTTGTTVSWADTGCSLKYTQSNKEVAHVNAGTYNVVVSGLNANYSLKTGTGTGTLTINPKAITATLSTPSDKVYNGQTQKAVTANVTGATLTAGTDYDISYQQKGAAADPKNAGTYDVAFVLKNNNYSITSAPTGTYTIAKKSLTVPNTISIPAVKEGATGADLTKNATYTFKTADGIVGSDAVTVAYTVTYPSSEKNTTPTVTLTKGEVTGAAKDNYEVGAMPTGLKGTVTNLPAATWKDTIAPTKTMDASDANNTSAYLTTGILTDTTVLPSTGKVMVDGAEKTVTLTWAVKSGSYDAKSGTYTYEATVADSAEFDVSGLAKPTATVTVNAVNVTPVTVAPISAKLGETAPTLPVSGTTKAGEADIPYTITWVDADGNPVTELKTDAVLTATYTGTVTYDLTGKEWATEPTDKTVTLTYTVSDKDKTVINSVEAVADVKTNAADEKNTAEDIASLLPATVKAKDADGNDVELAVTWATTDTFEIKGGEYTYTATFTDDNYDVSAITEPVTVKITVAPVTLKFNKTFKDLSVKKKADNSTFETLGVAADALSGTIKADDNTTEVPYTIDWSPNSTEFDTSKAGNKQEFTGTVTLTAPEYVTVVTPEPVKMTIKVKQQSSGGGGTTAYTVTFSAGKNGTMEGKANVLVNMGGKIASTSVPTIKPMDGYKFIGWSIDGETTVDPTSATVAKDVKYTALYEEAAVPTPTPTPTPSIDTKYTKPYASGYEDGTFRPNNNITRCELAAMIARLINQDDIPDGQYVSSFPDVSADAWANKYIGYLEDKGILSGYEDGTFRPYNTITRGEMCAVIARAQKYATIPVDGMFSDVTNDDWAKDYITTLASMNIVSGYEDGSFGTYAPITRAETVAIINRVLDPSTAVVTFTPSDIAGHWAEADIILAVNERKVNGTEPVVTPEPETTPEPEEQTEAPEVTEAPETTKAPEATEKPEA